MQITKLDASNVCVRVRVGVWGADEHSIVITHSIQFFVIILEDKLDKQTTEVWTGRLFTLEINIETEKCIFFLGIKLVFYTRVVEKKCTQSMKKCLESRVKRR